MSVTVLRGRVADVTEFRRTAPEILDGKDAAQFLGVSERYLHDNARVRRSSASLLNQNGSVTVHRRRKTITCTSWTRTSKRRRETS